MAITFTNLGGSTTSGAVNPDIFTGNNLSSYSNSSWTPPITGVIALWVISRNTGGGTNATPTVSGNNITWTQIATVTSGTNVRVTLFIALAFGSTTGSTTIDFSGTSQEGVAACFSQVNNLDKSSGASGTVVQSVSNTGTSTTPTAILASAGNSNNRPFAGIGVKAPSGTTNGTTPRSNWSISDDLLWGTHDGTSPLGSTEYRSDAFETSVSATIDASLSWAVLAVELKAGGIEYLLTTTTGSFTTAGTSTVLKKALRLTTDTIQFNLTGTDTIFGIGVGYDMVAESKSFFLNAGDVEFKQDLHLITETIQFDLVGNNVGLIAPTSMPVTVGQFSLVGNDVVLNYTIHNYLLIAGIGVFNLTGNTIIFKGNKWQNETKNTISNFTNNSKNIASFVNQSKNVESFVNIDKS